MQNIVNGLMLQPWQSLSRRLNDIIIVIICFDYLCLRYIMENVDLVLVGAEGVVESGGIINKVSVLSKELTLLLSDH